MRNELDLMELALQFGKEEGAELLKWYKSHYYTKSIRELVSSVNVERGKRKTDASTSG